METVITVSAREGRRTGYLLSIGQGLLAVIIAVTLVSCNNSDPPPATIAGHPQPLGDNRSVLSEALAIEHRDAARAVIDPLSNVQLVETGILRTWKVYRVDARDSTHPFILYVGLSTDRRAMLLTGNPSAFVSMAQSDGVAINSSAVAIKYAEAYRMMSSSPQPLSYVVRSVNDIRFADELGPEDDAQRQTLVARFDSTLVSPHASRIEHGFLVTIFVVNGDLLERRLLAIGRSGSVDDRTEELARDLPVL